MGKKRIPWHPRNRHRGVMLQQQPHLLLAGEAKLPNALNRDYRSWIGGGRMNSDTAWFISPHITDIVVFVHAAAPLSMKLKRGGTITRKPVGTTPRLCVSSCSTPVVVKCIQRPARLSPSPPTPRVILPFTASAMR